MSFEDAVAAALARDKLKAERRSAVPYVFNFSLPMPPTVNHYFVERAVPSKHKPGKFVVMKTPGEKALEFRKAVGQALLEQRIPLRILTGKLAVTISVVPADRRRRDLDNLLKPLLDALVRCELIEDDSDIDELAIRRLDVGEGRVIVEIREIPGAATTSGRLDL